MKKSKIFMASGALLLAISAVFASKANKKFLGGKTAYATVNSIDVYFKYNASAIFTSATGSLYTQAYMAIYSVGSGTQYFAPAPLRTIAGSLAYVHK